jgi:hypothetical protein
VRNFKIWKMERKEGGIDGEEVDVGVRFIGDQEWPHVEG